MFDDFELIHSHSRAQMFEDGDLVDVSATAKELFKFPCAMTRAAFETAVAWTDEENRQKGTLQDQEGRLWDVLYMASIAGKKTNASEILYTVLVVPREGKGTRPQPLQLKAVVGPGDTLDPVITIMLPDED